MSAFWLFIRLQGKKRIDKAHASFGFRFKDDIDSISNIVTKHHLWRDVLMCALYQRFYGIFMDVIINPFHNVTTGSAKRRL